MATRAEPITITLTPGKIEYTAAEFTRLFLECTRIRMVISKDAPSKIFVLPKHLPSWQSRLNTALAKGTIAKVRLVILAMMQVYMTELTSGQRQKALEYISFHYEDGRKARANVHPPTLQVAVAGCQKVLIRTLAYHMSGILGTSQQPLRAGLVGLMKMSKDNRLDDKKALEILKWSKADVISFAAEVNKITPLRKVK